jgi:hypothetical protein
VNVNDTAISSLRSPLAGNYTIGATGDFATLTLAANTLNSAGVNGPVNFSFIDNEYNRNTGEVFPITLNSFVGMSPSNPISFRPALGVNPNISDSNALALIIFNGARYVNFIGTNLTNSTNRGMVIQNRSLSTGSNVFILRNEARGINISNINFRSGNASNI